MMYRLAAETQWPRLRYQQHNERGAHEREVFVELDLVHHAYLWISVLPVVVHHERHWDEEQHDEQNAPLWPDAQQDDGTAEEKEHARAEDCGPRSGDMT